MLVALAAMIVAAVVVPASANAAIGITNFNFAPSTTQAAAHPNVAISFNRTGSESDDIKNIDVELPRGFFQNPENATKCTTAQYTSDTCPVLSQMGTMSTDVTAIGILNTTAPGTIYMLTPDATDTATLGMILRPPKMCILFIFCAVPNKMFLKTAVKLRTFGDVDNLRTATQSNPTTSTASVPLIVTSFNLNMDITIKKITLNFQGRYGAANNTTGKFSMVATTSCMPSTAKATLTAYNGGVASATKTYTPTGCPSVPFNPSIAFSASNTSAGQSSPTLFTLNVPAADATIQNAHPKTVNVDLPLGSGVDLNALSGVTGCTEAQLRADTCPASTVIGTASSVAPYLPPTLTGTVYAMEGLGNQVPLGVVLNGARGTKIIFRGVLGVRGDTLAGTARAYALFDVIPQLPYADMKMNLTKPVYKNPLLATCGAQTVSAQITGFNGVAPTGNGTVVTRTTTYPLTNCPVAPVATITSGPANGSSISDDTPSFTYSATVGGVAAPTVSFSCKIDSDAYSDCTTQPFTSRSLASGSHTFSVFATNQGVAVSPVVTRTFTVTTGVTITPVKANPVNDANQPLTTAGAHPDLDTEFNISGGKVGTMQIKMPRGFAASLTSRPLCAQANATAGTCAAASEIADVSMTVTTPTGSETGVGKAYLTTAPTVNDAGGAAVRVPFSFGTFIAGAGAFVTDNGAHQVIDIRSIPGVVGTTDITITNVKMRFDGTTNRLLTNASNCNAGVFTANGTDSNGGGIAAITYPYQATGCSATVPPFNPTLNQVFDNPNASTSAIYNTTHVNADVNLPIDNATLKRMKVYEPPIMTPNYASFGSSGDQCPAGSVTDLDTSPAFNYTFNPVNCPSQSRVGSMTITTPLLPTPLTGNVHLVNRSPLPWMGVAINSPGISIRLVGITDTEEQPCDITVLGYCPSSISVDFDNLPDTPVSSVRFALDSGPRAKPDGTSLPGQVLAVGTNEDPNCVSPSTALADVWSNASATPVRLTQAITINGCLPQ